MRGTVLLVEDERDTREMLAASIDRAGYRCATAADAANALTTVAALRPDVVVADIVLGDDTRGGLRLLRALQGAGVRAPVVLVTAYADVEKAKIALNEGAAYLLEKPFRAPELLQVIERVRTRSERLSETVEGLFERVHLTDKERKVARRLLEGLSSTEIAGLQGNSARTIRQHVSQIYAKCGVGSRAEFLRLAFAR
jgi:DNA-binding NarL/FixJ family response regulator